MLITAFAVHRGREIGLFCLITVLYARINKARANTGQAWSQGMFAGKPIGGYLLL